MNTEITPEVVSLANRVAAAFMREDTQYVLKLINAERLRWEAEGRDQHRRDLEKIRDSEIEYRQEADVYFETKDGLRALSTIKPHGYWPMIWKQPCRTKGTELIKDTPESEPIEVRIYVISSTRAKDGRPVYIES